MKKLCLIGLLAACSLVGGAVTPQWDRDGTVHLGPVALRLAWFDGDWRMTGQQADTVVASTLEEKADHFALTGELRLFNDAGSLRLQEEIQLLPGEMRYQASLTGKPDMACRCAALILQLPVAEFAGKNVKVDDKVVTLSADNVQATYPEFFHARRLTLPLPEGELTISGDLSGYFQDERNYGGSFYSIRLLGTPVSGTTSSYLWAFRFGNLATGVAAPERKARRGGPIVPIDLSKVANMGWRDDVAGDRKGGWTDQGENDVRDLQPGEQTFFEVPFRLLDPERNQGRSAMIFAGPDRDYFLKSAKIDGINRQGDTLYFLHALSWAPEDIRPVAEVMVRYSDGSSQQIMVESNRDVCNWWNRVRAENAQIAWRGRNPQSETTLYFSGFDLDPDKVVSSIELTPTGNGVWMVAAVSLGGEVAAMRPQQSRTIVADADWRPIEQQFSVEADSALDFSFLNHQPAGKFGWVKAVGDHFEFEQRPGEAVRFYGVNLCWSAHELTHEQSEELAVRLARLGYNSVRIHHYDMMLTERAGNRLVLDPERLDKLDYLIARMRENGLYVTIDLYTTRIPAKEDVPELPINNLHDFRAALPLVNSLKENYKNFARKLLTHVNPYTGLSWAADPAIYAVCTVNENLMPAPWKEHPVLPSLYRQAFADWCKQQGIAFPAAFDDSPEFRRFILDLQKEQWNEFSSFLRNELNVKALLSDNNNGESLSQTRERSLLDYADFHGYWEHPVFIEKPWQLPHYYTQRSAVRETAAVPRMGMPCRILGKPYMITEFDYCFPNRQRGEGGLLTGAYAGFQNWSGLYRFAYSHFNDAMFEPKRCDMFDAVRDPINQFADRIAALMFRRFDVAASSRAVPFLFTEQDFPGYSVYPEVYSKLGLLVGIGSLDAATAGKLPFAVTTAPAKPVAGVRKIYAADATLPEKLAAAGIVPLPKNGVYVSDTGELRLDSRHGTLTVLTGRTEGFVLPVGAAGHGKIMQTDVAETFTSCVLSSIDGRTLADSRRMVLFQLTDVMNSGITFRDQEQTILEDYGTLPLLLRRGALPIVLRRGTERELKVWALDLSGKRIAELPVTAVEREWHFTLNNAADAVAVLSYEIERID